MSCLVAFAVGEKFWDGEKLKSNQWLFDNQNCSAGTLQVRSNSAQGAGAPTTFQAMKRIVGCLGNECAREGVFECAILQSFLVSADMAHGVHPNFADKHEENHRRELQKGIVIKHNANQRYATSGVTSFLFKEVAKMHNLPTQAQLLSLYCFRVRHTYCRLWHPTAFYAQCKGSIWKRRC